MEKIKKNKAKIVDIAVLGPENTFSDITAKEYINTSNKQQTIGYFNSIQEIFDAVIEGRAKSGLVPIENILQGTIRETLDELFSNNIHIEKKIVQKIYHSLVALNGVKKSDINEIMSHPQALQQCKKYLKKNFTKTIKLPASSTFAAFEKIKGKNDRHSAAIIPKQIAKNLELNVLAEDIGDSDLNRTAFVLIKKGSYKKPDLKKKKIYEASIAFTFDKDKAGSLFRIIKEFAADKINLSRIESRPSREEIGNYIFFIDFKGKTTDGFAQKTLDRIKKKVEKLKILGIYEA